MADRRPRAQRAADPARRTHHADDAVHLHPALEGGRPRALRPRTARLPRGRRGGRAPLDVRRARALIDRARIWVRRVVKHPAARSGKLAGMSEPNIAFVANLMADPSRAAMCQALAGGEARPAGELAARAGVSAQTASNHLAKLVAGRILRVEQQGRWRYYRLAGAEVGHVVEALAVVAPPLPSPAEANGHDGAARRLKDARTCYSHLAGRLGVALADALVGERWRPRGGVWTGPSGGPTWPAPWARRSPSWRWSAAGCAACAAPARCSSRRRVARSCGASSIFATWRKRHDHAEHPLHHRGEKAPGLRALRAHHHQDRPALRRGAGRLLAADQVRGPDERGAGPDQLPEPRRLRAVPRAAGEGRGQYRSDPARRGERLHPRRRPRDPRAGLVIVRWRVAHPESENDHRPWHGLSTLRRPDREAERSSREHPGAPGRPAPPGPPLG